MMLIGDVLGLYEEAGELVRPVDAQLSEPFLERLAQLLPLHVDLTVVFELVHFFWSYVAITIVITVKMVLQRNFELPSSVHLLN